MCDDAGVVLVLLQPDVQRADASESKEGFKRPRECARDEAPCLELLQTPPTHADINDG